MLVLLRTEGECGATRGEAEQFEELDADTLDNLWDVFLGQSVSIEDE